MEVMLDIKFVRAHPEIVRADLEKRQDAEKLAWVEEVLALDKQKRELEVKNNELRARRNQIPRSDVMKASTIEIITTAELFKRFLSARPTLPVVCL